MTTRKIKSWRGLIQVSLQIGYKSETQIKDILAKAFGEGQGATKQYDVWYDYLERWMKGVKRDALLKEWDLIWNRLDKKPEPIWVNWSLEKMREHIERYRNG